MKVKRKQSAALAEIVNGVNEDKLRRTKERMLVAIKIADALSAEGISQKHFAEMTGRSKSEISEWLSGDRNFTVDTLSDIEAYLGVNLLDVSAVRTAVVQKEVSGIKIPRRCAPVVYAEEILLSDVSSGWLPASDIDFSVSF